MLLISCSVQNDRTNIYKNSQFDYVLDQEASQRKAFDKVGIANLVKQVVDGYHATVFAYGQTGSGKTFTMEGYKYKANEKGMPTPIIEQGENQGIVPRAIHLLFEQIKQQTNLQQKRFTVYCSYLQVYKEKIFDLLNKSQLKRLINDGPGLKLKWNKHDHFTVENLYTFECRSPDDILALYHFGIRNKVVASHNMNNSSSRSHTMLSLTIEQVEVKNPDNVVLSKLQLVDLAGSERQAFTGNQTNKESIDINKSLFTLRQVITALTDKKNQNNSNSYIPYRESKLTSLLRQSLGGNSYCLMIACLNPCDLYIEENINTLQYASKASFISNKPIRNDDPKMRLIEELKKENKILNEELAQANDTIQFLSQITGSNPQTIKQNLQNVKMPGLNQVNKRNSDLNSDPLGQRQGSASSAITEKREDNQVFTERIIKDKDNIEKFFKDKSETLSNIANMNKPINSLPNAAIESKDAITERIIHIVNMMKEVLQSNLNLRETIQKQSEIIDNQNADFFQLQNENEDLRDRVQILEEYTGKDSYNDVTKLVKEKKVLENRVKHLEQTSNNWAQFQATRQNFHQQKDNLNQSQVGLIPKATLNNEFNDDYEPVRCAVNQNDSIGDGEDNAYQEIKQKRKVEQINFQKQVNRGKNTQPVQSLIHSEHSHVIQSSDRHQEYKIRTVKSLANAYHHQQPTSQSYFRSGATQAHTTKNKVQNSSASKFINQSHGMNQTTYEKQRNSIGFNKITAQYFNGNNTQDVSKNKQNRRDQQRSKSPEIKGNKSINKYTDTRYSQVQNRVGGPDYYPKGLHPRERATFQPSSHQTITITKGAPVYLRPPKSSDKYSDSQKKSKTSANFNQNSHRDRMNASADYISNGYSKDNSELNISDDPYEGEQQAIMRQQNNYKYEDDANEEEYYDEDNEASSPTKDAYEAMHSQQMRNLEKQQQQNAQKKRSESGLGQLDVSLPMIRKQQQ